MTHMVNKSVEGLIGKLNTKKKIILPAATTLSTLYVWQNVLIRNVTEKLLRIKDIEPITPKFKLVPPCNSSDAP